MASKTEGIALLSMYNDEEEEEEEKEEEEEQQQQHQEEDNDSKTQINEEMNDMMLLNSMVETLPDVVPSNSPQNPSSSSPEVKALRSPTPPPWPKSQRSSPLNLASPSPALPPRPLPEPTDWQKGRRGALMIVDYEHDEAAMSPEAEEGEIVSSGQVVVGMDIQPEGNFEERTPPGTVQLLTPSTQPEPPQPADLAEQSRSETSTAIDSNGIEPEIAQSEIAAMVSEEVHKDDPVKSFLPPPVTTKCPEELQEKINKLLAYKKAGKSFNAALRNGKEYRNPDFLQHAVRYQEIDQMGTYFSKDVFDPHGYCKSDYFDEIEADMKHEMERKEQERKKSQKVEFVPGGAQSGTIAPALKINTQISVAGISGAVTSGSVSAAPDATRDIRQTKKSKWDKIDGDIKNPLHSSGHDNLSAVGVHAAHLSSANAGSGYTAFAQQKRKEAEERRSGERKFDKRS